MSPNAPPTPLTITSIAAPYPAPTPQLGRRLTLLLLKTDSVIVYIHANHSCVSCRGIKDNSSSTVSMEYGGDFQQKSMRKEFFDMVL